MAPEKPASPLPKLRPLPIRVARLHSKLLISALVGIAVIVILLGDWRLPTRLLAGWNFGIALYLAMMHTMMWRCNMDRLRKRASEQDEGAFAILMLSMAATLASLVAIVFEIGGSKQAGHELTVIHVLLAMATIVLSWAFVHTIFRCTTRTNIMAKAATRKWAALNFPAMRSPTIGTLSISPWSSA
jgi:uncharacterized membrane protein